MKHLKTYSQRELHYESVQEIIKARSIGYWGDLLLKKLVPNNNNYVELPQEIIDELKDICLELTDKRFIVDIQKPGDICLSIYKRESNIDDEEFIYTQEMSEVIERIKDYLTICGFVTHIYGQTELGDYYKIKINHPYYNIVIYFTKK